MLARRMVAMAVLIALSMTTPAHAGIMDYMFNAFKDLTTPVEPVTPAEETITPIPHPVAEVPAPVRTLVFDVRDAQTGETVPGATCSYYRYNGDGVVERGMVTLKDKPELALPAGTAGSGVSIWASGYASSSPKFVFNSKSERTDVPVRLEKGTTAGGTVVNEEGQPIEGVVIELQAVMLSRDSIMLGDFVTDAQGCWTAQNVPPETETLTLLATHPAYVPSCKVDPSKYMLTVPRHGDAVIRLVRGVPVSGRVVDEQGNAVAGAHLYLDDPSGDPPFAILADGDMDGYFRLEHCPTRQAAVVASAPGFAPNTVPLNIVQDTSGVVVMLPPARPVVLQFFDTHDLPFSNARVQVNASRENHELYNGVNKGLRTDAQGMLSLADAPREAHYWLNVIGWGSVDNVAVDSSDEVVKVVVPAMGEVLLRAADASTGKTIQGFEVSLQNGGPFTATVPQPWATVGPAEGGEYKKQFCGPVGKVRYRIDAVGYRSGITRWIETDEGRVEIKLSLRPAPMREGHVYDAHGNPAPMPVVQWVEEPYFDVMNNTSRTGISPIKGDQRGVFSITLRDWEKGVLLVTTDTGAALVNGLDFEAVSNVHLKPWGRVICDMPSAPKSEVNFTGAVRERSQVCLSYSCMLDEDGHGVFDKVYPGDYSVSRSDASTDMRHNSVPLKNVTVAAGQTAQVLANPGRKVILQVVVPKAARRWAAARSQGLALQLRVTGGTAGAQHGQIVPTWLHTDASGRVEVSDLAPGAYELESERLFDPAALIKDRTIKRYYITDTVRFVVRPPKPGDDAPLDLGAVPMHFEGEGAPPEAKAPPP